MPPLSSGEYTKAELQRLLNASSKTVDRYRKRFNLSERESQGQAIRIIIDEEAARQINEFVSSRPVLDQDIEKNSPGQVQSSGLDLSMVRALEARLHEIEKEKIRLEGDIKEKNTLLTAKDEILNAKQSENDTLRTSLQVMETTVRSLQGSMVILEREKQGLNDRLNPPIPMLTAIQKPQTFLEKIRFLWGKN